MIYLKDIFKSIKKDLELVERKIENEISSKERFVLPLGKFLRTNKGKRVRPALVLFSANLNGRTSETIIGLAAQMEIIHTASLIHDDIIDKSDLRRGRPTLNSRFGDNTALVFGDYLFSRVFDYLAKINSPEINSIISNVIKQTCKGELEQLHYRKRFDISIQKYLEIITNKTAALFSACCEIGSISAKASDKDAKMLRDFGKNFGILFQLMDDYQDILGDASSEKKSLLTDLAGKKATAPLIYLWRDLSVSDRNSLFPSNGHKITQGKMKIIVRAVKETGAGQKTLELVRSYADRSKKSIAPLKNKRIKENLFLLVDYILEKVKN